jgi:diadenosine tetraphosphate (Ap4A) HIT family hydrolase
MSETAWSLHPQIDNDTTPVGELALCRVLAMNDVVYPWLILVPRRAGIVELADLAAADSALLMEEIRAVSRIFKSVTACDKINVAAIGNVVPQLHVHIVARRQDDPLWPKPVWGLHAVRAGEAEVFGRFVEKVREKIAATNDRH